MMMDLTFDYPYQNTYVPSRPAATPCTTEARRQTDWVKLNNDNLKFAYDILCLHHSPYEVDAANEIQRRIITGEWLDLETPPPPLHKVPYMFEIFPLRLLWKQRPAR
jgi:hypothetical protein